MLPAEDIVTSFRTLGISLWVDVDRLRYRSSTGEISPEKLELLRAQKAGIIEILKSESAPYETYKLSKNQAALAYIQSHNPSCAAYNTAFAVRISTQLDVRTWENCLQKLSARHPLLRGTIRTESNQYSGRIYPYKEVSFQEIDASAWDEQTLRQKVQMMQKLPFDLERGPLWKNYLFTQSDEQHVALFVIHHTIIDGWSFWQLLDEFFLLYESECSAQATAQLPPVTHQYSDYVDWQENWLTGSDGKEADAYWKALLANAPTVTELPKDLPRSKTQSYSGASHPFKVSALLTEKLLKLGKEQGVTLYSTLLSAFQILIHRYSRQEDLLVGTPMAGRMNEDYDKVIGYFVNLLPTRANFEEDPSFSSFVSRMHKQIQQSMRHQSYPFPLLANQFDPSNDRQRHPLFQCVFGLQDAHQLKEALHLYSPISTGRSVNLGNLQLDHFPLSQQEGQFDLNLDMMTVDGALYGAFKYRTDLFKPETLVNLERHFINLLQDIVQNPHEEVSKLALITQDERAHILELGKTAKAKTYPDQGCLVRRFEEKVELTPNAISVSFEESSLTYKELNARANELSQHLISLGIKQDDRVGLCLHRAPDLIVTILAILKAGATYIPVDHRYPKERKETILHDSGSRLLITQSDLLVELPIIQEMRILCLDTEAHLYDSQSTANPEITNAGERIAYIIYTSGSTGKPKGTLISHHNVTRLFDATEAQFGFNGEDVWTLFHSPAFDFSVWEIWGALLYGGRLVILPFEVTRSPSLFLQTLEDEGVTILNQTPSAFKQLIHTETSIHTAPHLPKLRCVVFGGEALDVPSLSPWVQRYGYDQPQLINMYGITETTVHVTYHRIDETDLAHSSSPIGRPIEDLQIYIVDKNMEPVPVGVFGEICVSGDGVSSGYLNRPSLNQEKFINHPFDPESKSKLYRSGDLGRFSSDGTIDYLGRIDQQVKIRGFRIELGEIQAQITQHASIVSAAVIIREDSPGDKLIVAYCVKYEDSTLGVSELRQSLLNKLPDYMIPAAFVFIDNLPLTTNGKLATSQLPLPARQSKQAIKRLLPQSNTEKTVMEAWKEVLSTPEISTEDNFFELGGNSLLMNQVFLHLKNHYGSAVTMTDLFQYPTIQTLSHHLETHTTEVAGSTISSSGDPVLQTVESSTKRIQQRNKRIQQRKQGRK